ncbi:BREX system P-loop protein BrxC [Sinorhizobium medicae]|uniref:BREX system P-loop protein BrxC n=1 Tax=Sinorhizobium medicae TaxID=110321 RepID=UPI0004040475|nr:BREX system P-loop protein BrxC [Sinorhizobium medicae]MDX0695439.1 BREX system P-loop protein BrxC [Sinorhizobium medicae]MDX0744961.1 BREX system P-loop protein BrxC [Sinorhizobium medicae]
MKLIAEVLDRDPRQNRLINNGQARIGSDETESRGELESFVCEGRYADGIVRIVESFVRDLGKSSQQASWVSGFYGSGKSHLIKMLTFLWENRAFSDGMTPVQLVPHLPDDVRAALRELDQEATRAGGAFAAAGTMLSGQAERPRYSVLSIILKAARLPGDFGQARFMLFLKDRAIEKEVRVAIEAKGSTLEQEVEDLFVSPLIADALMSVDRTLGATTKDVRDAIRAQFRSPDYDITKDQFTDTVRRVLKLRSRNDRLPLTLVVLDEVQIYVGESQDRAGALAEIAETFAKEFESKVMLVGAGQSALTSVPQLIRLLDRFTIRVQLDDADVETVTRKVLLRKKASERDTVARALDANAGAISRQLQSTRIAERPADRAIRVDDYPLLPVRRRFWEAAFRALDRQGTQAQLRSQLRILHDALGDVAGRPLGAAVAGEVLYDALKAALVQSGDLPRDAYERIESLPREYPQDGNLPRRVAALAYLISRLPRETGADIGVRATPEHLADLLVDDLTIDQGAFRTRLRDLIDRMVKNGDLVKIGEEVRIQTAEGRAWEQDFRKYKGQYANDFAAVADRREALLGETRDAVLAAVARVHGDAKVPRRLTPHLGDRAPAGDDRNVPLWVRTGWQCSEKDARDAARALGSGDGIVHLYIPKPSNDDLRDAIADMLAARAVIAQRGGGHGPSGEEARRGMETREKTASERAADLVRQLVDDAIVFVGGGAEMKEATLAARLEAANDTARTRLFPRFKDADFQAASWEKAFRIAREGGEHPFSEIRHSGDADQHPVGRAVLGEIGAGRTGAELRRTFERTPYGWPSDAVDAALVALVRLGKLKATVNGEPAAPQVLDKPAIGRATFQSEDVQIAPRDKIKLRGFLRTLVQDVNDDDLAGAGREFVRALRRLAENAGGDAPLPAAPRLALEDEAQSLAGNALLAHLLRHKDEIDAAITRWREQCTLKDQRLARWNLVTRLARHAMDIPDANGTRIELDGVRQGRQLLDQQDPLTQPIANLRQILVSRVTAAHRMLSDRIQEALAELARLPDYANLEPGAKEALNREVGLVIPSAPCTEDDEALAEALDRMPLSAWRDALDAVRQRQANAAERAARLAEPTVQTVTLERATLRTSEDVEAWTARQRDKLLKAIARGPALVS